MNEVVDLVQDTLLFPKFDDNDLIYFGHDLETFVITALNQEMSEAGLHQLYWIVGFLPYRLKHSFFSQLSLKNISPSEIEELCYEENRGGWKSYVEAIVHRILLPILHREVFRYYSEEQHKAYSRRVFGKDITNSV